MDRQALGQANAVDASTPSNCLWGYNPVYSHSGYPTRVILHGVASPDSPTPVIFFLFLSSLELSHPRFCEPYEGPAAAFSTLVPLDSNSYIQQVAGRRIRPTVGPKDLPRTSLGSSLTPSPLTRYVYPRGSSLTPSPLTRYLHLSSGQGVKFDPSHVLGSCVCPTVGAYRLLGRYGIHIIVKLVAVYRGTSLIRKRHPIGPYSRPMPRTLWWS